MTEREKETKLRERVKANFDAYIRQLQSKPASDLIEMASEIAAAKLVYNTMADMDLSGYADFLLQFENPLELLQDQWINENLIDHREAVDHVLWGIWNKGIDYFAEEYALIDAEQEPSALEQGVTMC